MQPEINALDVPGEPEILPPPAAVGELDDLRNAVDERGSEAVNTILSRLEEE